MKVPTKAWRFFSRKAFCGVWQDGVGYGKSSLGLKTRFFLANPAPARKILTFFSLTLSPARKILTFFSPWRGIGKEFVHFGKNLYFLARRDRPRRGKFNFFHANPTPARINSKSILAGLFLAKHFSFPTRLSWNQDLQEVK